MEFNVNPYYDDFQDGPKDNNYMRVLFKPGYAVQARELTQIQSIIQNQIKEFGDHVFKDGSPVRGGQLSLDTSIISLKLQPQYQLQDINLNDFNGKLIVDDTTGKKKAQVLTVDDSQTYPTLLVRYLTGTEFAANDQISIASDSATKALLTSTPTPQTTGSAVSMNDGVFYVDGYFVYVPAQTIPLDSYSTTPSYRVGLAISDTIVDSSEDSTLLDPAQGSFNYQAPGADRYQFNLILENRTLDSIDDSKFFELLRVESGQITKQVDYAVYSEIAKEFARRTYDESGDYTVKAWRATPVANTANTSQFDLEIESGKGYIKGYAYETKGTQTITLDKARTTSTSKDYELSLEYGNYFVVKNLCSGSTSGIFDTSSIAAVDLHCVDSANIVTTTQAAYANTKVGSAKIRNLTNRSTGTYYAYLIDSNTSPVVFTVAAASTNANSIVLPTSFSTKNDAYANVYVSVISGTGAGDTRKIASYNAANKTAFVDRNFGVANLGSTSVVSLNFSISDVESVVTPPGSYSSGHYTSNVYAHADIDVVSKTNRDPNGDAYLNDTDLNKLIFKFPETYIAQGLFTGESFYQRKLAKDVSFTSGAVTLSGSTYFDLTNEELYYGTLGQNLSDIQAGTNFLVVVKTVSTGNSTVGQVVDFTRGSPAAILKNTSQSVTLTSGYSGNFTADVFYNVKVNNAQTRTKTLYGNTASSPALKTTDRYTNGTAVTGSANVTIDSANGIVWYTKASENIKTPGLKQSLYIPDVIKVLKVYDSGNPIYQPNTTNAIDITNNYLLDSGQNDNYYDHASIILKDTANPPSGQTAILVQYFDHDSGTTGYFNADSYNYATAYAVDKIPLYSSKDSSFSLRDAIDFRPTRAKGTTSTALSGSKIPFPDLSMVLTYGFYLPRIDKLIATQNREFKLLTGTPAFVPQEPSNSDDGMTLYTVYVPPFTANIRDIKIKYFDNKRYTMRDIGAIDKRLQQVEYYTTLSLLEKKARSETVLYQDSALQKEKYGIIVDQFDGFNIADNKNQDLLCQLSFNELKPYKITKEIPLRLSSATGAYKINEKTFSISFTETPVISQTTATKAVSVQPYLFGQFIGSVKMTPDSDYWMSATLTPIVVSPPGDVVTPATPPVVEPSVPITGGSTSVTWGNAFGFGATSFSTNFLGFGFINWPGFMNVPISTPINSGIVQESIVTPDISSVITPINLFNGFGAPGK